MHEDDGRVVGFVALIGNEVGAIFVHPSHQRKGIGHGLMDKAKEVREELEVEVFVKNTIGRAFYAKYGFEPVAEKVHDKTGFDLLRLRFCWIGSMKLIVAIFGSLLLLTVAAFCGFGFLATFEPTSNAMAFRVGYIVIGLGCLVGVGLLVRSALQNQGGHSK